MMLSIVVKITSKNIELTVKHIVNNASKLCLHNLHIEVASINSVLVGVIFIIYLTNKL